MSSDVVIAAHGLGKAYAIFSKPEDRLKQMLLGRWRTYYQQFWALRRVDLEIRKGETWGIIGRNGSGKSTLLQLICGNVSPTIGSVTVHGRIAALLELGAGFNPEFTGRENVYINGVIAGHDRHSIDQRLDDILAFADIGAFIDQPVKLYSSGMFARLAFAVAINIDPDILVIDEALAVGDEAFQRKCFAHMERIKSDGATILFVSHASTSVIDLCDHAALLHEGEHLYSGQPKRAVAWYQKLLGAPPAAAAKILSDIRCDGLIAELAAHETSNDPAPARTLEVLASVQDAYKNDGGLPPDEPDLISQNDFSLTQMSQTDSTSNSASEAGKKLEPAPSAFSGDIEAARYDANLVTQSLVAYAQNGAEISQARLCTLDGEQVNCLLPGERYEFRYRVLFTAAAGSVKFYCMVKMINGTHLGGGVLPEGMRTIPAFAAGDVVELKFAFTCMLGHGTYFFNCGVAAGGALLHRILDVLTFRVQQGPARNTIGTVDLDVQVEFEKVGSISQDGIAP